MNAALANIKATPSLHLQSRLGAANTFNPLRPERKYVLNLLHKDDLVVARMLLNLAKVEPGENIANETFNGHPIDFKEGTDIDELHQQQLEKTERGTLCFAFQTHPASADMHSRSRHAARLLLPGAERWRCSKQELRHEDCTEDSLSQLDEEHGWTQIAKQGWVLHADGTLVKDPGAATHASKSFYKVHPGHEE